MDDDREGFPYNIPDDFDFSELGENCGIFEGGSSASRKDGKVILLSDLRKKRPPSLLRLVTLNGKRVPE